MINFIEGEITGIEKEEFENHLKECVGCTELFKQVSKAYSAIDREKEIEPNPFFFTRLEQRIAGLEEQSKPHTLMPVFTRALRTLAATLVIAVGILAGVILGSRFTNESVAGDQDVISDQEFYAGSTYLDELQSEPIEYYLLKEE